MLCALAASMLPVTGAEAQADTQIGFVNPATYSESYVPELSDEEGRAIHLLAWVAPVPAAPSVEFELVPDGLTDETNSTTVQGQRSGESDNWDFGVGAGFYVDATQAPWSKHYRMYSYVTKELPAAIAANFPARKDRQGIFGHSMGGHGALALALRNPDLYRSVSAFAPVVAPSAVPWGSTTSTACLVTAGRTPRWRTSPTPRRAQPSTPTPLWKRSSTASPTRRARCSSSPPPAGPSGCSPRAW